MFLNSERQSPQIVVLEVKYVIVLGFSAERGSKIVVLEVKIYQISGKLNESGFKNPKEVAKLVKVVPKPSFWRLKYVKVLVFFCKMGSEKCKRSGKTRKSGSKTVVFGGQNM